MHLHSFLKSALLQLSATALYAAPVITLNITVPSPRPEIPHSICATGDGGYAVCGTRVLPDGAKEGFMMKLNSSGVKTGGHRFSGIGDNEVIGIVQSFDGCYVTCSYYNGPYGGDDWKVGKYDSTGRCLWSHSYGFSGSDRPQTLIATADSGFLVSGYATKSNGDTASSLIKLDKNGNTQWYKVYESPSWATIYSVKQTRDGGYICAGGVRGADAWYGGFDAALMKIDALGTKQWYKAYGKSGDEVAYSVDTTPGGGFVFAGSTTSEGNGMEDALVVKTDSLGNYRWHRTFGGAGSDEALGIICREDCSYIVAGNMRSGSVDSAAIIYQFDSHGDSVWSGRCKGVITQAGTPLQKLEHNSFTLCYSYIASGDTVTGCMSVYGNNTAKVAAGMNHSLILQADGTLWSCGLNDWGQLGDGTTTNRSVPVRIMSNVLDISAGDYHSLILKKDGTLWGCGANWFHQLGIGTTTCHSNAVLIMTDVKDMAAGYWCSYILKTDGSLWSCGFNEYAQLGDECLSHSVPAQIMTDVKEVCIGFYHSLIIKTDGTLWACGFDATYIGMNTGMGYLGDGTGTTRMIPVPIMSGVQSASAAEWHSFILKTDGTLWACGYNQGQFGNGFAQDSAYLSPVEISAGIKGINRGYMLKNDETLWACGNPPAFIMNDIQEIASTGHSLLVKVDGTLWVFGNNQFGQLGDGTTSNCLTPVQIHIGD